MLVPFWMGTNMASPYKSLYIWGKVSPHILQKENCCDLNLGESLCIATFFLFSDSGLYLLNSFDFYFEWRDNVTSNTRKIYTWVNFYNPGLAVTGFSSSNRLHIKVSKRRIPGSKKLPQTTNQGLLIRHLCYLQDLL